jgi:undecaprenyl-diphosphatase
LGTIVQIDGGLLVFLQNLLYAGWLTPLMKGITFMSEYGIAEIILCLVLIICRKTRRLGIICAASLALSFVCCNIILKPIIDRARPWELFDAVNVLMPDPGDASFPSGHSSCAMSVAMALFLESRSVRDSEAPCLGWKGIGADPRKVHKWGIAAIAFALLTGFSRLYLGMHYPTDVVAGLILGALSACIVHIFFKKTEASRGIMSSKGKNNMDGKLG